MELDYRLDRIEILLNQLVMASQLDKEEELMGSAGPLLAMLLGWDEKTIAKQAIIAAQVRGIAWELRYDIVARRDKTILTIPMLRQAWGWPY